VIDTIPSLSNVVVSAPAFVKPITLSLSDQIDCNIAIISTGCHKTIAY
jgi:hypothetical protein